MTTPTLIKNLQKADVYKHPTGSFQLFETHISWVIIAGDYVYKIKKPVNFGFLDYSTLEKRKHYCQEEVRLNQLLSPEIYIEVVSINGSDENPNINGEGNTLEYAVKMRAFSETNLFHHLLEKNLLTRDRIDELAQLIASFHETTPRDTDSIFGTPEHVQAPVIQNFEQISTFLTNPDDQKALEHLKQWSLAQFQQHHNLLKSRKEKGFIRDCHGDLHLGNIVLFDEKPLLFDRIEFNDDLRWTDVLADIAFLAMDLDDKKKPEFAKRLLSQYFSYTHDYEGIALLPYYLAYRAIVRAKIALFTLSAHANNPSEQEKLWAHYRHLIKLATAYTELEKPGLILMHGFSGSGKSTVAGLLVESLGGFQIRSDIERKKLFNLSAQAKTDSALNQGIYNPKITDQLYDHLENMASIILEAGYTAIVDATFLKKSHRDQFFSLAKKLNVPCSLVDCQATPESLKQSIEKRKIKDRDPSEARPDILAMQIATAEPLTPEEQKVTRVCVIPSEMRNLLE